MLFEMRFNSHEHTHRFRYGTIHLGFLILFVLLLIDC